MLVRFFHSDVSPGRPEPSAPLPNVLGSGLALATLARSYRYWLPSPALAEAKGLPKASPRARQLKTFTCSITPGRTARCCKNKRRQTSMEVRRATPDDSPGVASLVTLTGGAAKYRKRYGNYNVAQLLETGYLCISAVEDGKMRAFVVIGDAPPRCKAVDAESWASTFCANYTEGGAIGTCAWIDFSAALDGDTAATRACLTLSLIHI